MKKVILFVMALIILSVITNAQDKKNSSSTNGGGKCFDENTRIVNLGLGLGAGYYSYAGYASHRTPAFSLSYEQPYKKRLGPGFLGVGGYLGFQSARYRFDGSY